MPLSYYNLASSFLLVPQVATSKNTIRCRSGLGKPCEKSTVVDTSVETMRWLNSALDLHSEVRVDEEMIPKHQQQHVYLHGSVRLKQDASRTGGTQSERRRYCRFAR